MNSIWFWAANVIGAVSVLAALAAVAVPAMQPRIFSKDYLAGLLFTAFGIGTLWIGVELALGTAVRMGPGYVPRMLAFILVALGGIISLQAVMARPEAPEKGDWRPFVLVHASVLAFAFAFDFAGLIPAIIATLLVAAAGGRDQRWIQTIISVVFLVILCVAVFKYALGLPMQLFELKV